MSPLLTSFRSFFTSPSTRQLLLWCLPALLVALVLRIVLTAQMPYAFYHDDTPDFLTTADELLHHHRFELHEKKTFLVPILFTLTFFTGIPALLLVPVMLHLLGMATILLVGALCRHWCRFWRVIIIPITLLLAINPALLWYEHTLMAESIFVFTTALVAYAGTLYALDQTRARYLFLLGALFLEAGGRPEGKLLFGFGLLLLVLVHLRSLSFAWPRIMGLLALALCVHFITRTAQAGLLLYTSVTRFTPTELKCAPGFDPYIAPIRADLQARWQAAPSFPKVRDRRAIAAAVRAYLKDQDAKGASVGHSGVNQFCLRLAKETCLKNAAAMPLYALEKFRAVSTQLPSGRFNEGWLVDKQMDAFTGSPRSYKLAKGLTGQPIADAAAAEAFFRQHYQPVEWFNRWQEMWQGALSSLKFPPGRTSPIMDEQPNIFSLATPLYFLLGALGLIAVAFRRDHRGHMQHFHLAWSATMLAFFFTLMLTANVRPRFRLVFEPYWFLYTALLLECAWLLIAQLFQRRRSS